MRDLILSWFEFLVPRVLGGGGGGDGGEAAAAEQRRLEEERQRRISEGTDLVNRIFTGGAYGVNRVNASQLQPGRTYYDTRGNPTLYQPPRNIFPIRNRMVAKMGQQLTSQLLGNRPWYSDVATSEGYTDDYFDTIADAYMAHYTPQIEDQYERAKRNVILGSPSRGSGYYRNLGDLATDYERERVALGQRAQAARASAKQDVESNRAQLIRAAEAGSAPDVVAQQAVEAGKFLRQPPAYEPLGDLFMRSAATIANARAAQRAGYEFRDPPLLFSSGSRKRQSAINVG